MGELKYSRKADKVGYLYRAALYLALGDGESGVLFLKQSRDVSREVRFLYETLVKEIKRTQVDESWRRVFAEKILDEYKRQMYNLKIGTAA